MTERRGGGIHAPTLTVPIVSVYGRARGHRHQPCDDLGVNAPEDLSAAERAFMLNAFEIDILPGVRGDLDEPLASAPPGELVPILLPLIDRGWIDVCRVIPWTPPSGGAGFQPGPPLAREELLNALADADNWEYPESGDWIGCVTLTHTPKGRLISW